MGHVADVAGLLIEHVQVVLFVRVQGKLQDGCHVLLDGRRLGRRVIGLVRCCRAHLVWVEVIHALGTDPFLLQGVLSEVVEGEASQGGLELKLGRVLKRHL